MARRAVSIVREVESIAVASSGAESAERFAGQTSCQLRVGACRTDACTDDLDAVSVGVHFISRIAVAESDCVRRCERGEIFALCAVSVGSTCTLSAGVMAVDALGCLGVEVEVDWT